MKILYAALVNEDSKPGYKIKVYSQCKAFENIGQECYLLILKQDGLCLYKFENHKAEIIKYYKIKGISKEIAKEQIACRKTFAEYIKKVTDEIMPDMVYIRRIIPLNPWIISTIKYIKREGINIAYEYPTYPWKSELFLEKHYLIYLCDCFYYKRLIKMVDMVPYIGDYKGDKDKFIRTRNAVDIDFFNLKKSYPDKKSIDLISVSHAKPYHGHDRLIKGLYNYYHDTNIEPKMDVRFHIVGTVEKSLNLKKMTEGYDLQEKIIFHGFKTGADLDSVFDVADIGIDAIGKFRRKDCKTFSSSLKSREYMARGLPIIVEKGIDFEVENKADLDFVFRTDDNDTPVNINEIVAWFNRIKSTNEDIREFAKIFLSWEKEMGKVISFFNEYIKL